MFAEGPTRPVTPLLAWVSAFQQTTCPMQRAKAQSTKQKTCWCHCFLHLACVNDSSGFPGRSTLDYLSIILTFYTGFTSTFASLHSLPIPPSLLLLLSTISTATARLFTFHLRILPAEAHAISTYHIDKQK